MESFFLKGFLIGLFIAMPVGPIGLLCIRNSLAGGMAKRLWTGIGAAVADSVYGAIAGFGLTAISSLLLDYRMALQLLGGLFLIYLGIKILRSSPSTQNEGSTQNSSWKIFGTTFFLTLTNPATILSFVAVYAGFGIVSSGESVIMAAMAVTLGVFFGSATWWLILSAATSLLSKKMSARVSSWINIFSGVIISLFGISTLIM